MFNYRDFLMTGFKNAVGKMADYQVIFNANGYYEKGVLTTANLEELQELIDAKNASEETPTEEEPTPIEESDETTDE